jgi:hypothetical protein
VLRFVAMSQIYSAGIVSVTGIQLLAGLRQFYLILNMQNTVVAHFIVFHWSNTYNVCSLQVFDDVAVELTMALLQYFNSNPPEERLFRCMKALNRFCQISQQDVPQLIQMIGPEPTKFRGISARVDDLITQISKRLR